MINILALKEYRYSSLSKKVKVTNIFCSVYQWSKMLKAKLNFKLKIKMKNEKNSRMKLHIYSKIWEEKKSMCDTQD